MRGRLIGIDYGSKRIGLAVCDALGIAARELTILRVKAGDDILARILSIAREERAVALVVGLPESPNAPPGVALQADRVRRWIDCLREATDLPVYEISEYLTSEEARELARELKRPPKAPIDDLAARVILQAWLDEQTRSPLTAGSAEDQPLA